MRLKIATAMMFAGFVAACSSSPPPPPPMAAAPEPPPAPAPAPMMSDGVYKGMAVLADDAPRRCRKMTATQTVRVRNNAFAIGALRGRVGPDGTVTMAPRRGATLAGTVSNGTLDVTSMSGGCSYHYTLTKA